MLTCCFFMPTNGDGFTTISDCTRLLKKSFLLRHLINQIKFQKMKKIFLLIAILYSGIISANAQDESPLIILAGQIKNLHLGNDLNVTLVSSKDSLSDVTVAAELFNKLSISFENNTLNIASAPGLKKGEKLLIMVNALENITVGQNSRIITHGVISAPAVKVYMRAGATAHIVTTGRVHAFSQDDVDITVTKRPLQLNAKLM